MKNLTIFFVVIVQLIYVCESWKTVKYGIGYDQKNGDLTHEHRTSTCPWLHKPKFAKMMCRSNGRGSICSAQCLAQHVFKNTRQSRMTLQCRHNNRWVPRPKFPDCVSNGLCRLTTVGNGQGKITCKTNNAFKHCTITCEDKTYNWYVCDPSGRWNRPLPQCAKDRNGRMGVQF